MRILRTNIEVLIISITALLLLWPYFVWNTYCNGRYSYMPHLFVIVCYLIFIPKLFRKVKIDKSNMWCIIAYMLISLYLCFDFTTKTISLGGISLSFLVVIYMFMNNREKIAVYTTYLNIYVCIILVGVIPYLAILLNITLPYEIIIPSHELKAAAGLYYHKIFSMVILYTPPMLRYSAMFDEPGVVGTISALFLVAEQYDLKLKKNIILLISGILSFSTAFYMITLIWILLKQVVRFNYKAILIMALCIFIIVFFQDVNTPFAPLNRVLVATKVVNGNFIGNSRFSDNFSEAEKIFYNGDIFHIIFGNGRGWSNNNPLMAGSMTYKFIIFDHGIIGLLLIIIWIITYIIFINIRSKCTSVYVLLSIFLLSMYQRPYVMNISYLIILIGGTLYCISKQKDKNIPVLLKEKVNV